MGAYENPAMIQDRSGEIFAQGLKEFSAGISKGIQDYGAALNAAAEQRRKNIAAQSEAEAKRQINAAQAGTDAQGKVVFVEPLSEGGAVNIMVDGLNKINTNLGLELYDLGVVNSLDPTALNGQVIQQKIQDSKRVAGSMSNVQLQIQAAQEGVSFPFTTNHGVEFNQEESEMLRMAITQNRTEGNLGGGFTYSVEVDPLDGTAIKYILKKDGEEGEGKVARISGQNPVSTNKYFATQYDYNQAWTDYNDQAGLSPDGKVNPRLISNGTRFDPTTNSVIEENTANLPEVENSIAGYVDETYKRLTSFDTSNPNDPQLALTKNWLTHSAGLGKEEADSIIDNLINGEKDSISDLRSVVEQNAVGRLFKGGFKYSKDMRYTEVVRTTKMSSEETKLSTPQQEANYLRDYWDDKKEMRIKDFVIKYVNGGYRLFKGSTTAADGYSIIEIGASGETGIIKTWQDAARIVGILVPKLPQE
jgi:hypothetical protein